MKPLIIGTVLGMLAALALSGCAGVTKPSDDDYQLGDTTRTYCTTTNPIVRKAGRRLAQKSGITLIDLCRARDDVSKWGDA